MCHLNGFKRRIEILREKRPIGKAEKHGHIRTNSMDEERVASRLAIGRDSSRALLVLQLQDITTPTVKYMRNGKLIPYTSVDLIAHYTLEKQCTSIFLFKVDFTAASQH